MSVYVYPALIGWFAILVLAGPWWSAGYLAVVIVARWFYRRVVEMADANSNE
jgi:hypothetical protein